mgnify:CR=1 FL=1
MRALSQTVLLKLIYSLRKPAIAPLLVFGIHILGLVSNFYRYITSFPVDIPLHFFGAAAMAFFLQRAFTSASEFGIVGQYHALTHRLLVFTSTCTVAVFWEFAEFLMDRGLGTGFQKSTADTIADLFLGVAGTLFVIILS